MRHKNLEIERLRAVAVLLTILVHTPFKQLFSPYLYSSFTGVDLFFVISGFVVSQSFLATLPRNAGQPPVERFENSRHAITAFYLRRIFRIAPSAFFYILLYWIAAFLMKETGSIAPFARPGDIFREGIAFAGGIYNYAMVYGGITTSLSHYYSLSIEEHFYLITPLLLVLCGRTSHRLVACAIGIGVVLFVARPFTSVSIADLSHTRFDELLYGVAIALVLNKFRHSPVWQYSTLAGGSTSIQPSVLIRSLRHPHVRATFKTLVGAGFCALLALLPGVLNTDILGGSGQFYFSSAAFCGYALVSVALVILASLERGWILPIPGIAPVLEYIGGRSYSLYLGHVLLIYVYNDLYFRNYELIPDFVKLTRSGYLLQFTAFLLTAIALAEITYRLVERPCRDFGKVYDYNDDFTKVVHAHYPPLIRLLITKGATQNVQDIEGDTPLMLAIRSHDREVTDLLLRYQPDVSLLNRNNHSAAVEAVLADDADSLQSVLVRNDRLQMGQTMALAKKLNKRRVLNRFVELLGAPMTEETATAFLRKPETYFQPGSQVAYPFSPSENRPDVCATPASRLLLQGTICKIDGRRVDVQWQRLSNLDNGDPRCSPQKHLHFTRKTDEGWNATYLGSCGVPATYFPNMPAAFDYRQFTIPELQ
ncbi:hypothetical protein DFQ30_010757 [Apophysomyces sp. BC1015]|nr:hypothetical protein DFQ30_010757 [Apophysomyces sp. BC1015]